MVRIHDSGDFFSQDYLDAWKAIAAAFPSVIFYAYTKSLHLDIETDKPLNLRITQSLGGKYDERINLERSHSRIFSTDADRIAAGYVDGNVNDILRFSVTFVLVWCIMVCGSLLRLKTSFSVERNIMRAYINPPHRKFSESELIELAGLVQEYVKANPKADDITLQNGILDISEMFDYAVQLRYSKTTS